GAARFGERAGEAPELPADVAGEVTSWALLPLAAYGRAAGTLLVWDGLDDRAESAGFGRADAEFLAALAALGGLLLEHARGAEALTRAERARVDLASRLRELDRLSSVGELATRVAQEARAPLASITAFARRAQRESAEEDPRREYFEIVAREAERLESMLHQQLEYARLEPARLAMRNLNTIVQEALQRVSETLVQRRVRLLRKLAPDLPELLLDEPRIRRVVENVIGFALESVPVGGRLKVESRRSGDWVAVDVAHDGARGGGELLEQLFVPFAGGAGGTGGAGVGLGLARQIVREHGGEVRARGEGEWGAILTFTLPIQANEDRRHARERRSPRTDRRRRDEPPRRGDV
ncbi:MAG TPA: ATP-binding protein, partial [Candidatus Acidoferrales bacterium]|nr:ATP-binding protein [Candidatus Acidoferrales bacterium]